MSSSSAWSHRCTYAARSRLSWSPLQQAHVEDQTPWAGGLTQCTCQRQHNSLRQALAASTKL